MKMKPREKSNILYLNGSSYDIGFQHGERAKYQVHNSLQTYEKMFLEYSNISWEDAIEKALLHVKEIERYDSRYIEEMVGLAKGAGVRFEDILALNTRSEIALVNTPDGCTALALAKPKTSKTWLAQNWDWKGSQLDSLVHLYIEQDELPSFQMITEAGIIGKIGCNNAGLGVCLNALVTDVWESKVPIHFGLRAILESSTIEQAIAKVDNNQMASPAHFLIASKSGEIASFEVSPIVTSQSKTDAGILTHTNHICSTEMKKKITEESKPDSFGRLDTVSNSLEMLNGDNTKKEDLFQILSNHDNYPNSICRHGSTEESGSGDMETVFSVVMNLTDNKLSWIKGKPCESKLVLDS